MTHRSGRAARHAVLFAVTALAGLSAADGARADDQLARGEYLAQIMDCTGCHTPGTMTGNPDMARFLGGGDMGFEIPGLGIFWPPNITPDEATGIGSWSSGDIAKTVRTGETPDGRILAPIMPYKSYAALNDEDAMALAAYLKSLPPVSNDVPDPAGSAADATLPYLSPVVPTP